MRIKLNEKQLEKLSDISSDIALVALASVVLPATLDSFSLVRIILGIIFTFLFWIISVVLRKK